jgi:hypothetical protein
MYIVLYPDKLKSFPAAEVGGRGDLGRRGWKGRRVSNRVGIRKPGTE